MLQFVHEPHGSSREDVHEKVIQTAAMALRVAMSLERYEYRRAPAHRQSLQGDGDER